jgi:hypothetical protein
MYHYSVKQDMKIDIILKSQVSNKNVKYIFCKL